jgi:Glycosyl hydrolases family 16
MGQHRTRKGGRIYAFAAGLVAVVVAAVITAIVHPWAGVAARQPVRSAATPNASPSLSASRAPVTPSPSPAPATSAPTAKPAHRAVPDAPPSSLPGWRLVYRQTFDGSVLPPGWEAYSGHPANDPYSTWDPANDVVSGGELHLLATPSGGVGGVGYRGNPQTYGLYLVRLKGDYEPGLQMSDIALLWPDSSVWPPEIDFFEDHGGTRRGYLATLHPGPDGDNSHQVHVPVDNNATQWHTYGVEWTPTSITFTLDGHPAGSAVSSHGLPAWPDIRMNLDLQSQSLGPAQPSHTIETMTVDWVAEYAMG